MTDDQIIEKKPTSGRNKSPTGVKSSRSKQKGNRYENEIAKTLGIWLLDDSDSLSRSLTSGAKKIVYTGDIVPQKQISIDWIFHIECKNGYKTQIPSFNNFSLIEKWLLKCLNETNPIKQPVIWLICRFHGYSSIFFTNRIFKNIKWKICINIYHNKKFEHFYCYKLDELLELKFSNIFNY
jgi:hypothetical protein